MTPTIRSRAAASRRPYSLVTCPSLRLSPALSRHHTLRRIAQHRQHPKLQIGLHLANGGLYARDGVSSGEVYFVGRLPTVDYDRLVKHTLPLDDFIRVLDVKFGVAQDVSSRQREYVACEGNGHKHLWFFSVHTDQRYRLERLMHLDFWCDSPRDRKQCSGKRCKKTHREFWPLASLGPLESIKPRVRAFLVAIGEPNAQILPLDDHDYAFS
ncbi:hypothetical protein C8F04DRAFT_1406903 [Mycena alexandri]|uniref:Uncharacterized protein n=1 Tax=Mycena alexandri TaxID=1745969 RepID=A0AAD6WK89_9AGAR|nr:hypothetical protein C8F04DRAFT_1406903 [Mycena alexandri]